MLASGARFDPEMYMDVDEVAYPEGHTLWDKVSVPNTSKLTLGEPEPEPEPEPEA